ncbi:alpha/beta fold hydrolase [Actinoplanes sp. N902-109]|uniref:alpha/beta fold hydrolase n=1 Tax=Actinoplanes sp. (strain N902-109) TaxID=649831 RepID=UPI0012FAA4DE|nr:alpha/beta fold hydrolase [Actinoplanes sp. N902-109]
MTDLLLIHGLTYDRRAWGPLRRHLSPGRRVLAVDLPGHGSSPRQDSYPLAGVVAAVHEHVVEAGLSDPVVVGHSAGAVIAHAYAARFPVTAVVNIDQAVLPSPFFAAVRAAEPLLRGPRWEEFWNRMLAGMGITGLPAEARELVETATDPRPDILLGYWDDILRLSDDELTAQRTRELAAMATRGVGYHWVTSSEPPEPYLRWLRSALPEAEVTVLPGGHFPHLAAPAELAALVPA